MKKTLGLVLMGLMVVGIAAPAHALTASKDFFLTATIPSVSGISISASSIKNDASGNPVFSAAGTSLSFDPLIYKTFAVGTATYNAWLPDHWFAIDVGSTGGAASTTSVTVTYKDTSFLNGTTGHNLGWKSTLTFMTVTGSGETAITAHGTGGKMLLKDIPTAGENVTNAQIGAGYLRMYLGIVTKDSTALIPDPAAGEVFTNGDKPGPYTGTLTISATIT